MLKCNKVTENLAGQGLLLPLGQLLGIRIHKADSGQRQDSMTPSLTGTAVAGDRKYMLNFYEINTNAEPVTTVPCVLEWGRTEL